MGTIADFSYLCCSGNLWEWVSFFFMLVSAILSAALGKEKFQNRELQRSAARFITLVGFQSFMLGLYCSHDTGCLQHELICQTEGYLDEDK